MNGMDMCIFSNHLPDFSFMSFIATLQLGLPCLTATTAQENAGRNWKRCIQ